MSHARKRAQADQGAARSCLFAGPTLFAEDAPAGVVRFGPAALGSVYRAVEAGYRRVGIVDGYFGNIPSVWHKEILFAVSQGVEVVGAGSMGALRAAELWPYGMLGLGRVFRMFRSGAWTDDDEVAVLHATDELGFAPLSDAMSNIRYTLRRLRLLGVLDRGVERTLIAGMKQRHFSERTGHELRRQSLQALDEAAASALMNTYHREYVDIKRLDARLLMQHLADAPAARSGRARRVFVATHHWRHQFKQEIVDVPPLR